MAETQNYNLQYDEKGRPFFQYPGVGKTYVSPVAMGDKAPADETGILHSAPQWNQEKGEWETPFDWGNLMNMVAAGTLTLGAANAIMAGVPAVEAAGGASSAATEGGLVSSTIGSGYVPAIPALSSGASAAGSGGIVGGIAKGLSTASDISDLLGAAGKGIGDAATAAGNNNLDQEHAGLTANGQNIAGVSSFENALLNRAKQEGTERKDALKDVYRADYARNPSVGPFNTKGVRQPGQEYLDALSHVAGQGAARLATPSAYSTDQMKPVTPYTPLDIKDVQNSTGTTPSTLQKVGNVVSPGLTIAEKLLKLLHRG